MACRVHLLFFPSAWNTLWPQERKRQRAFFLFGLALILQLDIEGIRTFFHTFFRLPRWYSAITSSIFFQRTTRAVNLHTSLCILQDVAGISGFHSFFRRPRTLRILYVHYSTKWPENVPHQTSTFWSDRSYYDKNISHHLKLDCPFSFLETYNLFPVWAISQVFI